MELLFVVDTTRLLVAAPLFLNKQSVASHKTVHGYNYRLTDADRSPCCEPEAGCPYAEKARLHDALVQHVITALRAGHQRGHGNKFDYGIENPDGLVITNW